MKPWSISWASALWSSLTSFQCKHEACLTRTLGGLLPCPQCSMSTHPYLVFFLLGESVCGGLPLLGGSVCGGLSLGGGVCVWGSLSPGWVCVWGCFLSWVSLCVGCSLSWVDLPPLVRSVCVGSSSPGWVCVCGSLSWGRGLYVWG